MKTESDYSAVQLCRTAEVTRQGFYRWKNRKRVRRLMREHRIQGCFKRFAVHVEQLQKLVKDCELKQSVGRTGVC